MNINTKAYWEKRFSSLDWEKKGGRDQTQSFAKHLVGHLGISADFEGTICDFGCGLGDAFPIYHTAFPKAKLIGVDFSKSAIEKCRQRYGQVADFIPGDHTAVPKVDIIISSAVFEHLTGDVAIARNLLKKCRQLFLAVPYKEKPLDYEHVNRYDEHYFKDIGRYRWIVYDCPGWSEYGFRLAWQVYFKNLIRPFLGRRIKSRNMFILFHFGSC